MEDLEAKALRKFDKLDQEGSIIFRDAPPIHVPAQPYNLQFRVAASLTKKPQIDIKEAEKQSSNPADKPSPFAKDPPDFVVEHVFHKHTLRFNKFCVVRPQFVLHTDEFESQLELLSAADLAAGWSVLCRLKSPYMVIYNGGLQGGWSLPHRHLQLIPRPPKEVHNFFPDIYGIENGVVPKIPFKHAARTLSPTLAPDEIFAIYKELLMEAGVDEEDSSHNLIMVREWMLVIPRSRASQEGVKVVNASAMIGMIWVPSEDVLNAWLQSDDPMKIFASLGKPW